MFWKKNKKGTRKEKTETLVDFKNVDTAETKEQSAAGSKFSPKEYGVLKGFYVSEKATRLNSFNQHVFKVFDNVTKNEVKKQIEKNFSVKVRGIKMINLPRKRRSLGRRTGFKKGFKKAIVVLEKGYIIDQTRN